MAKYACRAGLNVCILLMCFCSTAKISTLTVSNGADKIDSGFVTVCGQQLRLGQIPALGKIVLSYNAKYDSDYQISIYLPNGRGIKKTVGYVTNGMKFNDTAYVLGDSLYLKQQSY
jgi:hypothetical protein